MAHIITNTCKIFNFRKVDYFLKAYGIQPVVAGYDKTTGEKYILFLIDDEFTYALSDWNNKQTQIEYDNERLK